MKTPLFNYIRNLHFRQIVIKTCFEDFFAISKSCLRATSSAVLAADCIVSAICVTACDIL